MKSRTVVEKIVMTGLLIGAVAMGLQQTMPVEAQDKIRAAAVAGSFYPAEPAALNAMMDQMLAKVSVATIDGPIIGVVAPHAGYQYSGPVAAYSYAALNGRKFARVVVIAPSHFEGFDFSSIYDGDSYQTPLGSIPLDKKFIAQLERLDPSIRISGRGHHPTAQGGEHALEVQLPWLQHVLRNFSLVPIVMGDQTYASSRALGIALGKLIGAGGAGNTLIVASSDLSHYHPYAEASSIDRHTLHAMESWDYYNMSRNFQQRVWEACGGAPIIATMIAAERMGANQATVLRYANSGDVIADHSRVVGYGAVAFVKSSRAAMGQTPFSLSDGEKSVLLALARKSVEHAVQQRKLHDPGAPPQGMLSEQSGAFVTITKHGELRGCIGYTDPIEPLFMAVRDTATLAATQDPRFPPVSAEELPSLDYEISVLSPLRRMQNVEQIHVGEHGLLVKNGGHEGLLLPQVAAEQKWDRITFLNRTCEKAGMRPDCWKEESSDVFLFTALVFGGERRR